MSATLIPSARLASQGAQPRLAPPQMRQTPLARPAIPATPLRSSAPSALPAPNPIADDSQFVDYQYSPFPSQNMLETDQNPVPDLISDDVFNVLRANDLISEKGIRDHIIRRAFKTMREDHALKSSEALAKLQAIYPYLQIDTIRKIIYRIGPACHRKALI